MLLNDSTSHATEALQGTEIAIIGMACRIPGATTVTQFWHNLCNGIESINFFSVEELLAAGCDPALIQDPYYVPANGSLSGVDQFDAAFFGFTPREAQLIDPQQRLFLEAAVEALESAGYGAEAYRGLVGVYAGSGFNSYLVRHLAPNAELMQADGYQVMIANGNDFLPTRVSYKLNLRGPSVNIQTACSTSLVAVHLACQALLEGDCDLALAGGVSLRFPQTTGYLHQPEMIYSTDGHCRAFDAQASGTVGGNGLGIVILRRLADALADGDTIYAVIKGSAINNDGAQKVGFTAPSVSGQAQVIRNAQAISGVDPATITYIEAHGTGTKLGDPIEIAGLTQAFRRQTARKQYCAIGALKTNVGHLDVAAGVAGLIKTTLALYHRQLPPNLHFTAPNPQIDFAHSPFYVNTTLTDWPADGAQGTFPRRAGVSAFGLGGTNAHAVLEEAPMATPSGAAHPWQVLTLAAKTPTALATAMNNLADHLDQQTDLPSEQPLADVAYTLHVGRQAYIHRAVVVCQDRMQAVTALRTQQPKRCFLGQAAKQNPSVVFLFPGGGAQHRGMGADLYTQEVVFRQFMDQCAAWLQPRLGMDIRQDLYQPDDLQAVERASERTALALTTLFATEYALARLWISWGIQPEAMIGHSLGEYVAACLAGVFSLEDALNLVLKRGQLFDELPDGAMLSVALSAGDLQPYLNDALSLAAINTPSLSVVSGPTDTIAALAHTLSAANIEHRPIHIAVAAHSSQLTPILERFHTFVRTIPLHPPTIPFVSNLTGAWISPEEATDPAYWVKHLRHTVRFADGITTLLQETQRIFLEIGPGRTLTTLVNQHPARQQQIALASMRHPQEAQSDLEVLLTTLGKFWLAGGQVDWQQFHATETRRRLPLPTYPFERQRYWIDLPAAHASKPALTKKTTLDEWLYQPTWKQIPAAPVHIPSFKQPSKLPAKPRCWLLFADGCDVGAQLAQRLRNVGDKVNIVRPGASFSADAPGFYTLDPSLCTDYAALAHALQARGEAPNAIVHLWNITPLNADSEVSLSAYESEQVDEQLQTSFYSLLALTQMLDQQGWSKDTDLWIVSNNLHNVLGTECIQPLKATALGFVNVIPYEYPTLRCRNIDFALSADETTGTPQLLAQLWAELHSTDTASIVAYRGPRRWLQSVEPLRLPAPAEPVRLRQHGVYLITGGLGGIGGAVALYLAERAQAKLILVGRSDFPVREFWEEWLAAHGEADITSQRIRHVQTLEQLGTNVLVYSADVACHAQMAAVITQAQAHFGPIQGFFHAAGVPVGGTILRQQASDLAEALAAKVQGTLILERLLSSPSLELAIYFSSLNAIAGGFGQTGYAAANAFLDAFTQARANRTKPFIVSINWDRWQQTGMSIAIEAQHEKMTGEKLVGMTPAEGIALLDRILHNETPVQVINFIGDIRQGISLTVAQVAQAVEESPTVVNRLNRYARPNLSTPFAPPKTETEKILAEIFQTLLGIESVGIHDNFFELGGHSLLGTQLLTRVRNRLQTELSLRNLFTHSTIAELSEQIEEQKLVGLLQEVQLMGEDAREEGIL